MGLKAVGFENEAEVVIRRGMMILLLCAEFAFLQRWVGL